MEKNFCLLSLSLSSWSYPFWTSRQCLMYELAAHCDIFYLNERIYWRNLLQPSYWRKARRQKMNQPFAPPDTLTVIDPGPRFPFFYGQKQLNGYLRDRLVNRIIRKIRRKVNSPVYAYVWHPDCLEYLDKLDPAKIIYHPYDKFVEFCDDSSAKKELTEKELELVRRADAVITPHARIAEDLNHPNSHVVSNAVFMPAFSGVGTSDITSQMTEILADISFPRIGYIGAINQKIDFKLLAAVAAMRPEWSIILMGPTVNRAMLESDPGYRSLRSSANVHFFPAVNFKDVSYYMQYLDIGCMPYSMKGWMSFCQSPLKLYQYWALGKPVVSTPLPNLKPDPGILSIGATGTEWVEAIEWELENNCTDFRKKRHQNALLNSWGNKANEVYSILKDL